MPSLNEILTLLDHRTMTSDAFRAKYTTPTPGFRPTNVSCSNNLNAVFATGGLGFELTMVQDFSRHFALRRKTTYRYTQPVKGGSL